MMVNSLKPTLPVTTFASTHDLLTTVGCLHMWAKPSVPIVLFYPGLHMQHIQAAHSPSPWITQMYSSQVLRAGKQDQSASLWPYSLWLYEYMRLKHRERVRVHVCWYLCMHMHECTHARKRTLIWEQPCLLLWETGSGSIELLC